MTKKGIAIILALLLCLSCGCSMRETSQKLLENGETDGASVSAQVSAAPAQEQTALEVQTARDKALSVAEQYRDVYEHIFSPDSSGLYLSESETGEILDRFAALGYAAIDTAGSFSLTNPSLMDDFFRLGGELSIYEICTDGGFLCHHFFLSGKEQWVIRTRLFWSDGGPFSIQGTVPVIGYADKYALLSLDLSDGVLSYEYDLPGNPPGTSHDGHIDTLVHLPLG